MVTVREILAFLFSLAPEAGKEPWDHVGLMAGDRSWPVETVLVALDPFYPVCQEAAARGAQLLVTHHPLFFGGTHAVTDETEDGRSAMLLLQRQMAHIAMHTNLDAAHGGVNDCLAARLGLREVTGLTGDIPCLGRIGVIDTCSLPDFLAAVKEKLGCPGVRYCDGGRPVRRVAVGGGACGEFLRQAADAGCDTFVTGDVKYNQFRDAQYLGLNLIDAGHFWTEDPVCAYLAAQLRAAFPALRVIQSETHTDVTKFA